jgi:hypothetical protein
MLTRSQLALAQADAIARLARLRTYASADLTETGQLVLALHGTPDLARSFINDTLGQMQRNVALMMLWEKRQAATA